MRPKTVYVIATTDSALLQSVRQTAGLSDNGHRKPNERAALMTTVVKEVDPRHPLSVLVRREQLTPEALMAASVKALRRVAAFTETFISNISDVLYATPRYRRIVRPEPHVIDLIHYRTMVAIRSLRELKRDIDYSGIILHPPLLHILQGIINDFHRIKIQIEPNDGLTDAGQALEAIDTIIKTIKWRLQRLYDLIGA